LVVVMAALAGAGHARCRYRDTAHYRAGVR
jgi:hypothetical protein